MTEKHICYVVNAVGETSVPADIATAVAQQSEFKIDILAWFNAAGFERDDTVGVRCINAPDTSLGIDRRTYRRARDHLREYDLIQVHHNHSGAFAKVMGKRQEIPLVSREGNTRDGFTRKGRIANGLTNGLVDAVVCVSSAVYESFTRYERFLVDESDVHVINNGVSFDRLDTKKHDNWSLSDLADLGPNSVVVGNAALLTEQKAYDVLISAVARADERADKHLELVIAGDGPLREELEAQAAELNFTDSVHFLGMLDRDATYELMRGVDIFAMPSRWEGFSAASVEALGIGNACVFSDIDPFRIPFEEIAMFHSVDDPAALSDILVELAEDPQQRQKLADRAREYVRNHYSMERVVQDYSDLYTRLLNRE